MACQNCQIKMKVTDLTEAVLSPSRKVANLPKRKWPWVPQLQVQRFHPKPKLATGMEKSAKESVASDPAVKSSKVH